MTVIELQNINKYYKLYEKPSDRFREALSLTKKGYHKNYYALKDVSFSVERGENVGIVGVNGAGKSTLLKIITGVLTPSSGACAVQGKISALLELGTGFNPEFTGMENIYLNGTMMGYTREQIDQKIGFVTDFAGIGEFIHQPVKTYSSGMYARLAFAVAINVDPEILIVDEVLSVGDLRFQIKCMKKMKEMLTGGATVLFVSHDTNAIRRFCTKAIWLNNGVVRQIGEVNAVLDQYLDFLKQGDSDGPESQGEEEAPPADDIKPFAVPATTEHVLAEIVGFYVLDKNGKQRDQVAYDEYVKIQVVYDVYDESVPNPVLGVALRSIDDDYICGLNTLLDRVQIPWRHGRNTLSIEYPPGLRAVGGKYYFDTALFEETATVPIQFLSKAKDITITSDYVGEGRYIAVHNWLR
jgi:lipopolysaccharide transport system ATP-binding protein/teichoic acid transport system ATP-binding protein